MTIEDIKKEARENMQGGLVPAVLAHDYIDRTAAATIEAVLQMIADKRDEQQSERYIADSGSQKRKWHNGQIRACDDLTAALQAWEKNIKSLNNQDDD